MEEGGGRAEGSGKNRRKGEEEQEEVVRIGGRVYEAWQEKVFDAGI